MNPALGCVSAGGLGSPLFDVTHNGGGPNAFVAAHPAGNVGGVTLSKFSFTLARPLHGPHLLRLCASRGPSAAPAAMSNITQKTLPDRLGVNLRFMFLIMASGVQQFYANAQMVVNFPSTKGRHVEHGMAKELPRDNWFVMRDSIKTMPAPARAQGWHERRRKRIGQRTVAITFVKSP